jgi:Bacterial Ig-like domain (group 2)
MNRTRLLVVAAIVGAIACEHDSVTDPFAPLALDLDLVPENATLTLGSLSGSGSVNLTVTAKSLALPVRVPPGRVFTSSDTSVALVDQTGHVIATGVGTTVITVRVNDERGRATIVVVPP